MEQRRKHSADHSISLFGFIDSLSLFGGQSGVSCADGNGDGLLLAGGRVRGGWLCADSGALFCVLLQKNQSIIKIDDRRKEDGFVHRKSNPVGAKMQKPTAR